MEPLRNLLIKELTSELHAQRWELTHRRLARFGEKGPLILLDPKLYQRKEDLDGEKAVSNVKDLGALLSSIEPHNEMGLLKLMGWYEVAHKAQLYHVFYAPPGCTAEYSIVTLHDYLGEAFRPSLTERVGLAHSLSQKVKYIHEHGYYHKGITNDNVVFFRHASEARSLTRSYLTGFDFSRKAEMGTWSEKPL